MAYLRLAVLAVSWCCLLATIAANRNARADPAATQPVAAVVAALGSQSGVEGLAPLNAEAMLRGRGLDVTVWRGIVVGSAAASAGLRETLSQALPLDERRLVFHQRVSRYTVPEEMPVLLDAVRVLYRGDKDERAARAVNDALRWIVGNQLDDGLWQLAEARSGRGQWLLQRRTADAADPCTAHLILLFERPAADGEDLGQVPPFRLTFHGPEFDTIAKGIADQRAVLDRGEFTRRVVEAQRKQQSPFFDDPRAAAPVRVVLRGVTVADAAKRIAAEAQLPLTSTPVAAQSVVTVVSEGAPVGDVLLALTRIAGLTLARVGEGYSLTAPRTTAERLWNALPLPLWALARGTPVERQMQREVAIRALWPLLPAASSGTLHQLPEAARAPAAHLLEIGFAAAFGIQMEDLPDATGAAHLALYEDQGGGHFLLGTPGATETIGGASFLRLKAELMGTPWVAVPAKGDGK